MRKSSFLFFGVWVHIFSRTRRKKVANASIGTIGRPYYDPVNDRTKAFITKVQTSLAEAERTMRSILAECQGTRLSLRLIVAVAIQDSDLKQIDVKRDGQTVQCEAIVPIGQEGLRIVYFGWNNADRTTPPHYREAEIDLLGRIQTRRGQRAHDYAGYTLQVNGEWSAADVERLISIYQETFTAYLAPFTVASVADMLTSNCVTAVRFQGEIVAVAMGEVAECELDTGRKFSLCEISEVATHPAFQRRGLSRLAFQTLIRELAKMEIDVVWSETRAASHGMMAVAWDAGMMPVGRLEQHCVIASPFSEVGQDGRYGDLVVFALPSSR